MTCKAIAEFLSDYLAGELPAAQRAEIDAHLSWCTCCNAYLSNLETAIDATALCAHEPSGTAPPGMPEGLVQAILAGAASARGE